MRALTLAVVLAFVAPSLPEVACASPKKARRYEKKGKKAYKRKNYDDAIVAFELAYEADDQPKFLFNIGRCWEKKGDLFKAMEFIQRYVAEVEEEGEKEDALEVYSILRGKLLKTSGEVVLDSEPSGASVRLVGEDDQELSGATPLTRWLPAGRWKLQIAADGYEIYEAELFVAVGKTLERSIKLERPKPDEPEVVSTADPPAPEPDKTQAPPASSPPPSGPGWGAWAALGGGAALLAGGAVLGLLGQGQEQVVADARATPRSASRAEAEKAAGRADDLALGANVLFAAGGAAVVAGAVLWLTADTAVRPAPGGLSLQASW